MRLLKNILFFILLSFSFNYLKGQQTVQHVDKGGYVYDWKLSNNTCFGCGSFYWSIARTTYPDDKNLYYFYLYFWSNSYYSNGVNCSSYVNDINIYAVSYNNSRTKVLGPYYFLAYPKTSTFNGYNIAATMYSADPYQIWYITWGGVTAY